MKINQIQRCTKDAAFPSSSSSSAVMIKAEFSSSSSPLSIFISSEEDRVKTKKIDSFMRRDLFYVSGYTARRRKKKQHLLLHIRQLHCLSPLSISISIAGKRCQSKIDRQNPSQIQLDAGVPCSNSNFLYSLSHLDRRVLKRCTSCDAIHAEQ